MFEIRYEIINGYMEELKNISLELFLKEDHDVEGFFEMCVNENSVGFMPDQYSPYYSFQEWLFNWFEFLLLSVKKMEDAVPVVSFRVIEEDTWIELIRKKEQLIISNKNYLQVKRFNAHVIEGVPGDEPEEIYWEEEILYADYRNEILKKSKSFIEEFQSIFPNLKNFNRISELQNLIEMIENR